MLLTRGVGRWQVLASKLLLLLLLAAAAFVVVSVLAAVSSFAADVVPPDEPGGATGSGKWSTAGVMFVKAIYAMAPYAALSVFLAVLTSSSSTAVAISIVYYFVELIIAPFFGLVSWLERVPDFLLGQSVGIWMTQPQAGGAEAVNGISPDGPGAVHAFLVILVYTVALGTAAFWIFQRRDVAGAGGE